MSSSRLSPATTWLWRRLTSRPARLLLIGVLAIVIVPAIALRVEAALFQRRAHKLMSVLSSLQIGVTPKEDVLSRLSGLSVSEHPRKKSECEADRCIWIALASPRPIDWVVRKVDGSAHPTLFSLLSWWGLRIRSLSAYVNFSSGKVSGLGYWLMLSTPDPSPPAVVAINVNARDSAVRFTGIIGPIADQSPDYQVSHSGKLRALSIGIFFTPDAPPELTRNAFALRLGCFWSLAGCLTANQLLPEAEQDRLRIERAANERMRGPNQCPDWILVKRSRNVDNILLIEVTKSGPAFVANDDGSHYRRAQFRLLRVLKGNAESQFDSLVIASHTFIGAPAHNSAFDLLIPGQKLLFFSNARENSLGSCEEIAATPSAIQTIGRSLGAARP